MEHIAGILLCAGSARRMGFDKLLTPIAGKNAVVRSMEALISGGCTEIVFVANEAVKEYLTSVNCPVPFRVVNGGAERRDSVKNALLNAACDIAVIHDAARCLVPASVVAESIESARAFGSGIVAVPVTDTVFRVEDGSAEPVRRDGLWQMQTPQTFRYAEILDAYRRDTDALPTDDCTLYAASGRTPHFVRGTGDNFKLTVPEDFSRAVRMLSRYGTGFDTHRLVPGRKLILGGVEIPFETGLLGHSDADVLAHAVMDALLGAAGMPDIGHLFPDTDPAFEGADSMMLLSRVVELMKENCFSPRQVNAVIIAQRPKMAPYLSDMAENFSKVLGIPASDVSLSATTTEGMNDEGRGLCISVRAIACVS